MKCGTIIYVVGDAELQSASDPEKDVRALKLPVDRIEVIARRAGHFEIADAWWALIAKGMQHIDCRMARYTAPGRLELTGQQMRLCG